MSTRPETAEQRMAEAQKRADEARIAASAAEEVVTAERQRLASEAEHRQRAWAQGVHDAYPQVAQAASESVASARTALSRAVLEDWPSVGSAYVDWRFAASDANHEVARLGRAASDLKLAQPATRYPYKDLATLAEIVDVEMSKAVRLHDLEREDSLVAELDAVGQGRWEEPFLGHSTGCPGGPVETIISTRPGTVEEVARAGRVHTERGPATTLTVRRCQVCGGQTVEQV